MTKKLMFDTLSYVKLLTNSNVSHADIHAEALVCALDQNLYTRNEVDRMIEDTFRRFDERTREIREEARKNEVESRREFERIRVEIRLSMQQLRQELQELGQELRHELRQEFGQEFQKLWRAHDQLRQEVHRIPYTTIGVLGSLIVVMGTLNAWIHHVW